MPCSVMLLKPPSINQIWVPYGSYTNLLTLKMNKSTIRLSTKLLHNQHLVFVTVSNMCDISSQIN